MKLLIVEPWFTAIGHPAQSMVNTARALGPGSGVGYLISDPGGADLSALARELQKYGPTQCFQSHGSSLRTGTLLSLPAVLRIARKNGDLSHVFFLDADLVCLAAAWPLVGIFAGRVVSVSAVYLGGPERIAENAVARKMVSAFLSAVGRRLFLRTSELMQAWQQAFPEVPRDRIDTIPSLEIPQTDPHTVSRTGDRELKFGVIGQVRPGKSLEWLVPMFVDRPGIGTLHVAGTFTNARHQQRLSFLIGTANFDNRVLSEADMLLAASKQDYLIALYDDWDARMEAATVYLAARVGRPVIVYNEGWPGRVVREFGCGVAVGRTPRPDNAFFSSLPRPGETRYQALLDGVARFRDAHDSTRSRAVFLDKLMTPAAAS